LFLAGVLLAACLCAMPAGCVEESVLIDRQALRTGGRYIVLPLADAPGDEAKDSGKALTGVIMAELLHQPAIQVFDITPPKLAAALEKTGFSAADTFDPVVAAELGRHFKADRIVCGELVQFAPEQCSSSHSVSVFSAGETTTRYWVSVNLRVVNAADGRIIYIGRGSAIAPKGYLDAAREAVTQALRPFQEILRQKS
jgi:hypothetical protein